MTHRVHLKLRSRKTAALALLALFALAGGVEAQTTTAPATGQPGTSSENLIKLNEGIRAFLSNDYEKAKEILTSLRQQDPDNAACLYYLGLIYLDDGLKASGRGERETARAMYTEARKCMERVVQLADRRVIPVQAAVDLGIAQLASEDYREKEEARKLATQAAQTLREYVATKEGQEDAYGYFFLGIAQYRLDNFVEASQNFDQSKILIEQVHTQNQIGEEEFTDFETNIVYYRGLIDFRSDHLTSGIEKMKQVRQNKPTGELAKNAEALIDEAEKQLKSGGGGETGSAIMLKTPIGALRFEGYFTIGNGYDSNVILLGENTILPVGIAQKYDYVYGVQAGFDLSRNFTKRELPLGESLTIGIGGDTFNDWHPSVSEYDLNENRGRVYISWEAIRNLYFGLQYDYSYTQLGHGPFFSANRITPFVTKVWRGEGTDGQPNDRWAETSLYFSYDDRNYLDQLASYYYDRDGNYYALYFRQSFWLWKARDLWPSYYAQGRDGKDADRRVEAFFGYTYRNEDTQGFEYDLYGNGAIGGITIPLPWRLTGDIIGEFTWDRYLNSSLIDFEGKDRFDFIQRYSFGLTRTLIERGEYAKMPTLRVRLRGSIDLTFQDSNIWDRLGEDFYTYNRGIYGVRLIVNF